MEVKTVEKESKPEANEYVLNCKKICGTASKLTLQSSGPSEKRVESEEGNEASNNNLPVKYSKKQMKVEETKKELKHTIQESNWVQEKLNGNRRKLSLVSFAQSQKSNDNENEKLVPKNISSCTKLSVASSGHCHREEVNQCQDTISKDENTNVELKKLHGLSQKQLGSSEIVDFSGGKMHVIPQLLPSDIHVIKSDEAASVTPTINYSKPQPQKDCVERIEEDSSVTSHEKFSLVEKKLSLGSKGPSGTHNKENVEPPVYKRPRSSSFSASGTVLRGNDKDDESGLGNLEMHGRNQKQSPSPLTQLQERTKNQNQQPAHSESLFSLSKSNPKQQDRGLSKKQCFDQVKKDKTFGLAKQKEAEELLTSYAVVVLDSEDSDEEKRAPSRSKPLLARKRLGKWKV